MGLPCSVLVECFWTGVCFHGAAHGVADGPDPERADCLCDDPHHAADCVDVGLCLVYDGWALLRGLAVADVGHVGVFDESGEGAYEFVVVVDFGVGAGGVAYMDHF